MSGTPSFILYRAYASPAVYVNDGAAERCLVMRSATGTFVEDDSVLDDVMSSSPDVRRISAAEFELLVARALARGGNGPQHLKDALAELQNLEHEAQRRNVTLTPEEKTRIAAIAREAMQACLGNPAFGLPRIVVDSLT